MGSGDQAGASRETQRFQVIPSARILAEDRTRFSRPTRPRSGGSCAPATCPLGYLDDESRDQRDVPRRRGRTGGGRR